MKRNFEMLIVSVKRISQHWWACGILFVTYAVINSYTMGPSWRFISLGLKDDRFSSAYEIFFGTSHSQVQLLQAVTRQDFGR